MIIGLNVLEAVTLSAPDRQGLFALIKHAGIDHVRVEFPWVDMKTSYVESDDVYHDAVEAGLDLLVMIAHPPDPLPSAPVFQAQVATLALRYPLVHYYEIWNEPNAHAFWPNGDPETFVSYLAAGYKGVAAGSPAAKVVLGGLGPVSSESRKRYKFWKPDYTNLDPVSFLTDLYAAGGGIYFDVVAIHPYCRSPLDTPLAFDPADPYVAAIAGAHKVMVANGDADKEFWGSEYGFEVTPLASGAAQLANLMAQTAYLEQEKILSRAYIMGARDTSDSHYGMLTGSDMARPSYGWLKELVT